MSTLLTLGLVGVGGYLFIKEVWPMLKDSFEDFDLGLGGPPTNYYEPPRLPERGFGPIIEDRFPDYVVEDRYPDYVIEDRYPDYYPYPVPQPYPVYPPVYNPPYCGPGRYWNGDRCKKIDIDCPPGYKEDDGRCKPRDRNCDRDEFWNGHRCEKLPKIPRPNCDRDEFWNGHRCERLPRLPDRDRDRPGGGRPGRTFNTPGDKWNKERDREEKIKEIVTGKAAEPGPETKRALDIVEKATQSFLEVYYA